MQRTTNLEDMRNYAKMCVESGDKTPVILTGKQCRRWYCFEVIGYLALIEYNSERTDYQKTDMVQVAFNELFKSEVEK